MQQPNNYEYANGFGGNQEEQSFVPEDSEDEDGPKIRALTQIDDIKVNDGTMKMKITKHESQGFKGKKYTIYMVEGWDSLGEFQITRRYKEFLLLRDVLFSRYPGLYIPPIPQKQIQGKMAEQFIEERTVFLNEFLQQMIAQKYLASSPELQVFIRPKQKVGESLKSLEKVTTTHVLKYYNVKIRLQNAMEQYGESKIIAYNDEINKFVKLQKNLLTHLRQFKNHIHNIVPMKEHEVKSYKAFADFLKKYEDGNEKSDQSSAAVMGTNSRSTKLISGESKAHLKNNLDDLSQNLTNPFKHIRNWVKGEVMNLEALMQAISEKEACLARKQRSIKQLQEERESVSKINQGKFMFSTMLKSSDQKKELQTRLMESI
mmetsp:Transcript_2632/g.4085  ORF Transcript_2632/g.4085 Transcript_2632/m.4085 type:complete len:374 (+) Transcript_2632:498-1619(+)